MISVYLLLDADAPACGRETVACVWVKTSPVHAVNIF